ncbi:unnamed protein product, partial [Coregonus sp. 'balchen']
MRKQKLKKGSSREAQLGDLWVTPGLHQNPPNRMAHVLQFDEQTRKVKDANMQDEDTFEIYDPRNPGLGMEINPSHVTDQASLPLTYHFETTVSPACLSEL